MKSKKLYSRCGKFSKNKHPQPSVDTFPARFGRRQPEETFTTVYWRIATAIYLAWSFQTGDWNKNWILWAIAGVLFGAVKAVMRGIMQEK